MIPIATHRLTRSPGPHYLPIVLPLPCDAVPRHGLVCVVCLIPAPTLPLSPISRYPSHHRSDAMRPHLMRPIELTHRSENCSTPRGYASQASLPRRSCAASSSRCRLVKKRFQFILYIIGQSIEGCAEFERYELFRRWRRGASGLVCRLLGRGCCHCR